MSTHTYTRTHTHTPHWALKRVRRQSQGMSNPKYSMVRFPHYHPTSRDSVCKGRQWILKRQRLLSGVNQGETLRLRGNWRGAITPEAQPSSLPPAPHFSECLRSQQDTWLRRFAHWFAIAAFFSGIPAALPPGPSFTSGMQALLLLKLPLP